SVHLIDPAAPRILAVLTAAGSGHLARTPGGFCAFGDSPEGDRLAVARPDRPCTVLYAPLGRLRQALDRPDKVRAALAGALADDDLEAELRPLGWGGGVPWDGEVVRLNIASPPPNPFVAGPPLKGVDRLPGREAVIADLIARIDNLSST